MNWYDVATVARKSSVSETTVRRMIDRGELKFKRWGRLIRIPESELLHPTTVVRLRQAV